METMSLNEFQEWVNRYVDFTDAFTSGYNASYEASIKAGGDTLKATLDGLQGGFQSTVDYATLNAQRAAAAGDSALADIYKAMSDDYLQQASEITDKKISSWQEFNDFRNTATQSLDEGLGSVGRAALEKLGPLADGLNMGYEAYQGDWEGLGESASGALLGALVTSEAVLSAGVVAATLVALGPVMGAVLVGAAAVGAVWLGGKLWDWSESLRDQLELSLTDLIETLAGGFKDNTYRIVRYDPLALDLNGDGVISTAKENDYQGALFDEDGDGIKTATGWIGPDDGLLVRDLKGNGQIDSGAELFGEQTVLSDGTKASDGFAALASLDSNGDGVVDPNDPGFSTLRVWRDANGNGITDAGELLSLSNLGITSFSVAKTLTNTLVDGGNLLYSGSFTKANTDGTTAAGVMGDFNFNNDTIHSQYTDQIAVPDDIAALPDMQGIGTLRSLHEAAALSPALAADLKAFAAATTRADQMAILDTLLFDWAKTSPKYRDDGIKEYIYGAVEDDSSGNIIYLRPGEVMAPDTGTWLDDATTREIRVAQAVLGEDEGVNMWWEDTNIPQYSKIYDTFAQGVYTSLAGQSRLSGYINSVGIQWSDDSDGVSFDFSTAISQLKAKFASDELVGISDLIDLLQGVQLFSDNKGSFSTLLSDELNKIDADGLDGALKDLYSDYAGAQGAWTFTSSS
ncbi:MAG TPA: hypothetical protein VFT66_06650, partial [Roseiflexaceae bacterium]|nr:hypothetical protein [Roseiflexaceae bacterium]